MLVRYKKNKQPACYDSNSFAAGIRPALQPRPHGPFENCGDCPYASPGFLCYSTEGDCMKTHMQKVQKKNRRNTE